MYFPYLFDTFVLYFTQFLSDEIRTYIVKSWKRVTGLDEEILLQVKPGCPLKICYGVNQLAFSKTNIIGTLKNELYKQSGQKEYYADEKEGLNELLRLVKSMAYQVPPAQYNYMSSQDPPDQYFARLTLNDN